MTKLLSRLFNGRPMFLASVHLPFLSLIEYQISSLGVSIFDGLSFLSKYKIVPSAEITGFVSSMLGLDTVSGYFTIFKLGSNSFTTLIEKGCSVIFNSSTSIVTPASTIKPNEVP